jgi:flagellin-like protein
MDIKQLIHDDDAVSPVIGVILMVAITVILAAVIASFVLGLGDQAQQATPQASFSFDYEENTEVTVTHDGGDTIQANELYVRGTLDGSNSISQTWANMTSGVSEVTAGNSVVLDDSNTDVSDPTNSYEIRVVYETQEGDTSATLAQDTGPDA